MTTEQFDIIGHTLGINCYHARLSTRMKDKYLPDEFYRNYYNYGLLSVEFQKMINLGYIKLYQRYDMNYFHVTEKGIQLFRDKFITEITSVFIPPSKSKQKYQEYIDSDYGGSFSDYLGINLPVVEYFKRGSYKDFFDDFHKSGQVRIISIKYPSVKGKYCDLLKDAKSSYKQALKQYKHQLK
jgi:hypothetical protein